MSGFEILLIPGGRHQLAELVRDWSIKIHKILCDFLENTEARGEVNFSKAGLIIFNGAYCLSRRIDVLHDLMLNLCFSLNNSLIRDRQTTPRTMKDRNCFEYSLEIISFKDLSRGNIHIKMSRIQESAISKLVLSEPERIQCNAGVLVTEKGELSSKGNFYLYGPIDSNGRIYDDFIPIYGRINDETIPDDSLDGCWVDDPCTEETSCLDDSGFIGSLAMDTSFESEGNLSAHQNKLSYTETLLTSESSTRSSISVLDITDFLEVKLETEEENCEEQTFSLLGLLPDEVVQNKLKKYSKKRKFVDGRTESNEHFSSEAGNNGESAAAVSLEDQTESFYHCQDEHLTSENWVNKMKALSIDENNDDFDVHSYKTRIISNITNIGDVKSFSDIINGQDSRERARSFFTVLELANSGTVEIIKPEDNEYSSEVSGCQDFTLKRLSTSTSGSNITEILSRKS